MEDKDAECEELGRELVQVLVDQLFNMPLTLDKTGRLVKLPKPTLQLPREKPVRLTLQQSWASFV